MQQANQGAQHKESLEGLDAGDGSAQLCHTSLPQLFRILFYLR